MKPIKLSIIIWAVYLVAGCTSISDFENLQAQLDSLKPKIAVLSSDVMLSKAISDKAFLKSANAENLANRMAQYASETLSKLDSSNVCSIPKNGIVNKPEDVHCGVKTICHILNPTPACLKPTRTCIDKAIAAHQVECQSFHNR